ncbi:MAG TPA: hypothetical protein VFE01_10475 [Terracidiphilus sp.]|nr:hypothetical protein [Terracidiphilus sp.]
MTRRVGFWALAGFAVALVWAAVFYVLGPSNGLYPGQGEVLQSLGHSLLLRISIPVALLGRHFAITWYWSAVLNAAIYGCFGLVVESIRLALQSSRLRVHH